MEVSVRVSGEDTTLQEPKCQKSYEVDASDTDGPTRSSRPWKEGSGKWLGDTRS